MLICKKLHSGRDLLSLDAQIYGMNPPPPYLVSKLSLAHAADPPITDLHHQFPTFPVDRRYSNGSSANGGIPDSRRYVVGRHCTILAASSAIGFVIYTEAETRAVMDAGHPQTKIGLVDPETNRLAKVRQKLYGGLKADLVCLLDSVHGYVRPISRTRRPQWFLRSVVRIRLQVEQDPSVTCFRTRRYVALSLS